MSMHSRSNRQPDRAPNRSPFTRHPSTFCNTGAGGRRSAARGADRPDASTRKACQDCYAHRQTRTTTTTTGGAVFSPTSYLLRSESVPERTLELERCTTSGAGVVYMRLAQNEGEGWRRAACRQWA